MELYEMRVNDSYRLDPQIDILRVPGGWIYLFHEPEGFKRKLIRTQFIKDDRPNNIEETTDNV